jgi:hypothetical protein
MKTGKPIFYLGLATFFCSVGLLIGASQSPVVGVFITGILGLVVGVAGFLHSKQDDNKKTLKLDLVFVGVTLLTSSVFLILGVYLGSLYRINQYKTPSEEFIWTKKNSPHNLAVALDWVRLNELLTEKGYSKNQIEFLYSLQDTNSFDFSTEQYYKILLNGDSIENARIKHLAPLPIAPLSPPKPIKFRVHF